ncbi:MAG: Hsp20 family protein [Bacilli bacterium]
MRTDISKRKGNYVFDIDIPGYQKDDIKVQLNDGYLTVMGEVSDKNTKSCDSQDCEWLHQRKIQWGIFKKFLCRMFK